MAITSPSFLCFVALGLVVYYLSPKKAQWCVLLLQSAAFYLWGGLGAGAYLLLTVCSTYAAAMLLGRLNADQGQSLTPEARAHLLRKNKGRKKLVAATVMLLNFGLLYCVKYWNFTATAVEGALPLSLPRLDLLMPLGLSFYIFQSIGYVLDVYRGKYPPERNLLKHALFLSFFPQMIQGPISRGGALMPQLFAPHKFSFQNTQEGLTLILWGLLKKMVLADRAALAVEAVVGHFLDYSGSVIAFAIALYCLQLYCDFSGGIDIVRGVAKLYGISLAENFERPIFATSLADFWRRWHISLGTWMKDYLFYPLSLSKPFLKLGKWSRRAAPGRLGKLIPTALATFIIYFIIGIWHGAELKYIAFGLWNGVIISTSQLLKPTFTAFRARHNITPEHLPYRLFQMVRTALLVFLGRYITRAAGLSRALVMLQMTVFSFQPAALFSGVLLTLGLAGSDYIVLLVGAVVLLVAEGIQEHTGESVTAFLQRKGPTAQCTALFMGLLALTLFGIFRGDYIAAAFIYQQF